MRVPYRRKEHIVNRAFEVIYFRHLVNGSQREFLPAHIPILPHIAAVKHNARAGGKHQRAITELRKEINRTIPKDNPNDRLDIISEARLNRGNVGGLDACGTNTTFGVEDEKER
jgi:hypothetical protein